MIELNSKILYVTKVLKKSKARYMMTLGDVFEINTSIQSTHNSKGNDVLRLNLIVNDDDPIKITMNEANRLFRELIEVKEYNEQNVLGDK